MAQEIVQRHAKENLLSFLKAKLPDSVITYSILKITLEGKFDHYKIYVDDWPGVTTVVILPDKDKCKNPFLYKSVFIFGDDTDILMTLLRDPDVIDWTAQMEFYGISQTIWEFLEPILKTYKDGILQEPDDTYLYYTDSEDSILDIQLPEGMKSGPLNEEAMKAALSVWKFKEDGNEEYLKELTAKHIPTICLYDNTMTPVGWIVKQISGDIGMFYVIPEHRGKGYGKYLLSTLLKIIVRTDGCAYSFIETFNTISCALHESVGMKKYTKERFLWQRFRYKLDFQ